MHSAPQGIVILSEAKDLNRSNSKSDVPSRPKQPLNLPFAPQI